MTMGPGRGRHGGLNAVFRVSLAGLDREIFDEDVGASSASTARLPALPVESEGRVMARLTRLDALYP